MNNDNKILKINTKYYTLEEVIKDNSTCLIITILNTAKIELINDISSLLSELEATCNGKLTVESLSQGMIFSMTGDIDVQELWTVISTSAKEKRAYLDTLD